MHSRSVELRSSGTTGQQDKGNGVPILFSISPKAPSIRLIARYHGLQHSIRPVRKTEPGEKFTH